MKFFFFVCEAILSLTYHLALKTDQSEKKWPEKRATVFAYLYEHKLATMSHFKILMILSLQNELFDIFISEMDILNCRFFMVSEIIHR